MSNALWTMIFVSEDKFVLYRIKLLCKKRALWLTKFLVLGEFPLQSPY